MTAVATRTPGLTIAASWEPMLSKSVAAAAKISGNAITNDIAASRHSGKFSYLGVSRLQTKLMRDSNRLAFQLCRVGLFKHVAAAATLNVTPKSNLHAKRGQASIHLLRTQFEGHLSLR